MYRIVFSKKAEKHKTLLKQSGLDKKTKMLLDCIAINPFKNPPPYEKLIGDFKGAFSRRINVQHRLVYMVDEKKREIFILSCLDTLRMKQLVPEAIFINKE